MSTNYPYKTGYYPSYARRIELGQLSRLTVSFDNASTFYELNVKKSSSSVNWDFTDATTINKGSDKQQRPTFRNFSIEAECISDSSDYAMQQLVVASVRGLGVYVGEFDSSGKGPLIYAVPAISSDAPINGVVTYSVKFNAVTFIKFFYTSDGDNDHPFNNISSTSN